MMTLEEQRIAVAEECGWTGCCVTRTTPLKIAGYDSRARDFNLGLAEIPNYPNDLNAMAEARKMLTPDEQEEYSIICWMYFYNEGWASDVNRADMWSIIDMTAAQHCEAFLRTRGKWKE